MMMGKRKLIIIAGILLLVETDTSVMAQSLSQRLKAETVEALASDARQKGNAVRGAIVFTQQNLNCTKCHVSAAAKPVGPDLTGLGSEATDVYLIEALLEPSKVIKKGFESVNVVTTSGKTLAGRIVEESPDRVVLQLLPDDLRQIMLPRTEIEEITPSNVSAMPDNLVDQLASREQFLDLVRYLMELAAADKNRATRAYAVGGKSIGPELQGTVLLKEFNCSACHNDDVTRTQLSDKQAPDLSQSVGRIDASFLQRFIADPLMVRPGTTMPHVMAGLPEDQRQAAAKEITHYLMSLGKPEPAALALIDAEAVVRGRELFHSVGCVACHSPRDDDQRELLTESSVPLGAVQQKYKLEGLVAFLKDPLKTRPSGRMPQMKLTHWEAIDVASYLLSQSLDDLAAKPFEPDRKLVAKGKTRFAQLGCRQCHRVDGADVQPVSLPFSKVRADRGCLSGERGNWPEFAISAPQRTAIQAALARDSTLSQQDEIGITLTAFRCLNCHQRYELGGVSVERDVYFHTENPNLGPQGRMPPTLSGVGAKLNPQWMRQVLVSGRTIRPYVLTRMPQYGTGNVAHLVDLFQQTDRLLNVEFATFKDQKEIRKVGAEMVGTSGLNCIVCHTFQLKKAANMPAVDLTEMAERLQKNWFYHYMRAPQNLSPNTIMPSFWPGGQAMRRDLLDGDRDLQIEALWQYLLDGRQAPTPRGLIQEPMELLATDEAVMLRRSYPGIGKRGIGVGYPNQINLAFDAEQMRLAMIWQGKFADPGGVWRSQGHGKVRPLGDKPIQFAAGPDVDSIDSPWGVDDGRPPQHRFMGYSLDEKMRPQFKYQFAGISVEDHLVDLLDTATGRASLLRTVTLKSDSTRDDVAFRAATGKSIEESSDRVFVVDRVLTIRLDNSHAGTIAKANETQQLRIPLTVVDGVTKLTLEYRW